MRLELTTPCLRGRCSNQLSYGPLVRSEGFEPPTYCSEDSRSIQLSYERVFRLYQMNRGYLLVNLSLRSGMVTENVEPTFNWLSILKLAPIILANFFVI